MINKNYIFLLFLLFSIISSPAIFSKKKNVKQDLKNKNYQSLAISKFINTRKDPNYNWLEESIPAIVDSYLSNLFNYRLLGLEKTNIVNSELSKLYESGVNEDALLAISKKVKLNFLIYGNFTVKNDKILTMYFRIFWKPGKKIIIKKTVKTDISSDILTNIQNAMKEISLDLKKFQKKARFTYKKELLSLKNKKNYIFKKLIKSGSFKRKGSFFDLFSFSITAIEQDLHNNIWIAFDDGEVYQFSKKPKLTLIKKIKVFDSKIKHIKYKSSSDELYILGENGKVKVFTKKLKQLKQYKIPINAACISSNTNGEIFLFSSTQGQLIIINKKAKILLNKKIPGFTKVNSLKINPSSNIIAMAGNTKDSHVEKIILLNTKGKVVNELVHGYQGIIQTMDYNSDGSLLASGIDFQAYITLWVYHKEPLSIFRVSKTEDTGIAVNQIKFFPITDNIASFDSNNKLKIWNINGTVLQTIKYKEKVATLQFSHDGKYLVLAFSNGQFILYKVSYK